MSLDIFKQTTTVTNNDRENLIGQKSIVIWLTGLSGSGKSTIANEIANQLHKMGKLSYILDGDNVRLGLNKDLGFSDDDRKENIRRIAETAKLMSDAGVIVITAFISPFINEREMAKQIIGEDKLGKLFSFQLNCVWNRPTSYYANNWRGTLNLDGGTLFTQFSHYIDVLIWLLGDVDTVNGYRTNAAAKNIEFEDTGAIVLKLKNGAIGTLHYSVNAFEKNEEVSLTIVAENGTLKLGGEYMNEVIYQNPVLIHIEQIEKGNTANDYGTYKGSMSNHDKVYDNIIRALNGDENKVTDGEAALKTVAFIEKIYTQIPVQS